MSKNQYKLVYVDDSKPCLFLAKEVLGRKLDVEVFATSSPEEAYAYIDENANDLVAVIADIRMPRVSGMEMLTEIRKDYSPEALPFILITAYPFSQEQTRNAISVGVTDICTKAFDDGSKDFDILMNRLAKYIDFSASRKKDMERKKKLRAILNKYGSPI